MEGYSPFDNEQHMYSGLSYVWTSGRKGFSGGSFADHLFNAFIVADGENLRRLSSVYPAVAKAFQRIKNGEE